MYFTNFTYYIHSTWWLMKFTCLYTCSKLFETLLWGCVMLLVTTVVLFILFPCCYTVFLLFSLVNISKFKYTFHIYSHYVKKLWTTNMSFFVIHSVVWTPLQINILLKLFTLRSFLTLYHKNKQYYMNVHHYRIT